jgi:hypothetical protein
VHDIVQSPFSYLIHPIEAKSASSHSSRVYVVKIMRFFDIWRKLNVKILMHAIRQIIQQVKIKIIGFLCGEKYKEMCGEN